MSQISKCSTHKPVCISANAVRLQVENKKVHIFASIKKKIIIKVLFTFIKITCLIAFRSFFFLDKSQQQHEAVSEV